jgi:hypothetical protein
VLHLPGRLAMPQACLHQQEPLCAAEKNIMIKVKHKTMKEFDTTWTKEELKVYILIFCANANFSESKAETAFIKSKTIGNCFERIHDEFDKDNDYQSIQKIRSALDKYGYLKDDRGRLFKEVKELFLSDGKYDILEQNLFMCLNHVFGN